MDAPGEIQPLTHAGGYTAAGFQLAAIMDANAEVRACAAKRWGCPGFSDFDAMMRETRPEVISFSVPTVVRPQLMMQALAYRPLAVIAEKPLAPSSAEAEDIVRCYREQKIPLIVNYTRRFVPIWQALRGAQAMTATIRYAKGLRHNGTHAIDLCRMLFGECLEAGFLASKADFWPDDPTVSAFLRFERCPEVYLQSLDERAFTLFEVDIVAPAWRLVVDHDGRRARRFERRDQTGIPPGKRLVESATEDTGAASAMLNLMRNLREVLAGAAPLCSGEDAVAAQRIAERLAA
jgi:predicted dehydrogenase